MSRLTKRLGLALRARRMSLAKTQAQVAKQLGVDRSLISRMERGEYDISVAFFVRWCRLLGLTMDVKEKE